MSSGDLDPFLTLRDGRTLAWTDTGDAAGRPIIVLHGTPGSRDSFTIDGPPWVDLTVRLICPDRPGYGDSTPKPDLTFADLARDIEELADHLHLDRFTIQGYSGGGPHAAACAALLPARIDHLILVSALGPPTDRPGPRATQTRNQQLLANFRRHPRLARLATSVIGANMSRWPQRALTAMTRSMPSVDQVTAARPGVRSALRRDLASSGTDLGRAMAQDLARFARPWSFAAEDITVPTDLWHGTADQNAPIVDARRLHHAIAGSRLHELDGAGHLAVYDHVAQILDGADPPGPEQQNRPTIWR